MHGARRVATIAGGAALATWMLVAWVLVPGADAKSRNAQSEARIELGRRLFQDPVASRGGKFSCASCHDPEHGFSDPRQFSVDENGLTARHSQPTLDLAGEGFHWDGEFETVEQLLVARLGMAQAALEQTVQLLDSRLAVALATDGPVDRVTYETKRAISRPPYYGKRGTRTTSGPPVVARLDLDGRYEEGFLRAFGSRRITPERLTAAVGAYMDTLRTTENAFDRYRRGDREALSESAVRGLRLFDGRAGCNSCHVTTGAGRRSLSDGGFHDTGVAYRGGLPTALTSLLPRADFTLYAPKDTGRAAQTFRTADDRAAFKTPSLRDVATRPPYMHDGSLETLADVVDYYARGGTPHDGIDAAIRPLHLTDADEADLVSFLESLTGEERPGLGAAPRYRPDIARVRILDLHGEPLGGRTVRVIPAGDRLLGTDAMPEPFEITTDDWGRADVAFPPSTQMRLETDGYELGLTRLIADWSRKIDVVATPLDTVSVAVRRSSSAPLPEIIALQRTFADGRTTDARASLTRVRRIDDDMSLYAAPRADLVAQLGASGDALLDVRLIAAGHTTLAFELDVRGGQSEPLDMRRDGTTPIAGSGVRDPRGARQSGGALPARPRGRSGPREATRPDFPGTTPGTTPGGPSGGGGGGGGGGGR